MLNTTIIVTIVTLVEILLTTTLVMTLFGAAMTAAHNALRRYHEKKVRDARDKGHVFMAVPSNDATIQQGLRQVQYHYFAGGQKYYMTRVCVYTARPIKMFYTNNPQKPFPETWEEADDGTAAVALMTIFAVILISAILFILGRI